MNKTIQTPYNPISGTIYKGMNIPALLTASKCLEWATFLQWKGKGYSVKKGEHGTGIRTFAEVETKSKSGKVESGHAPRYYTVFNRTQVKLSVNK